MEVMEVLDYVVYTLLTLVALYAGGYILVRGASVAYFRSKLAYMKMVIREIGVEDK